MLLPLLCNCCSMQQYEHISIEGGYASSTQEPLSLAANIHFLGVRLCMEHRGTRPRADQTAEVALLGSAYPSCPRPWKSLLSCLVRHNSRARLTLFSLSQPKAHASC